MKQIAFVALLSLSAPTLAIAQDATVFVTDSAGRETVGRIVRWSGSEIILQTGTATKTFTMDDVLRVDLRGDSLKNGALIGLGAGLAVGTLAMRDCSGCSAGYVARAYAIGLTIYTVVGAAIDAMIPGRTPLWRAGSPTSVPRGLTVRVVPERHGASIGWRF